MEGRVLFWWRWLVVVTIGIVGFGLSLVVAPDLARRGFGLLVYSSSDGIDKLGARAVEYIDLAHGVLGAVMVGWGVVLLFALFGPFRHGSRDGWRALVASLAIWFVVDTTISLWTGFWQNAVLNAVIAVLYAVPLAATYRSVGRVRGQAGTRPAKTAASCRA